MSGIAGHHIEGTFFYRMGDKRSDAQQRRDAITNAELRVGWGHVPGELIANRDWEGVRQFLLRTSAGGNEGEATRDRNRLRLVVESGSNDVWLMVVDRVLWWTQLLPGNPVAEGKQLVRSTTGWRSASVEGAHLSLDSLPSVLRQLDSSKRYPTVYSLTAEERAAMLQAALPSVAQAEAEALSVTEEQRELLRRLWSGDKKLPGAVREIAAGLASGKSGGRDPWKASMYWADSRTGNALSFCIEPTRIVRPVEETAFRAWLRRQKQELSGRYAEQRNHLEPLNESFRVGFDFASGTEFLNRLLDTMLAPQGPQRWGEEVSGQTADRPLLASKRLSVDVLERATSDLVWWAVGEVLAGRAGHHFGRSTDYDLLTEDGERLPPKAVFGVALARALGRHVGPEHFSAGIGTPCFRLLEEARFRIVPKGESTSVDAAAGAASPDEDWAEGDQRLVAHHRRERKAAAVMAKKAAFVKEHGRLFCERCNLDPRKEFGETDGDACIEVHHETTAIGDMQPGARTKLEDLRCVCANCHRVIHRQARRLRAAEQAGQAKQRSCD